jgi:hypothetical protein
MQFDTGGEFHLTTVIECCTVGMGTAEEYRKKAAEMAEVARQERNPSTRLDFHILAQGYLRLADQAERRDRTSKPAGERVQVQQQQQQRQPRGDG